MSAGDRQGLASAVRYDLRVMHETWMEFIFPRQRATSDTVLGKWEPQETREIIGYRLWSAVGVPVVGLVYPLVLLGYFFRFQTHRINLTALRLGTIGVVGLFVVLWGGLAALASFQFSGSFTDGGITAIGAASGVAVVSAALAFGLWRLGGRVVTVLFAYPLALTAIFLPPIVAALFSTAAADLVLSRSDSIWQWFVEDGPELFGLVDYLVDNYQRDELAHVVIWFAVSVPLGWILGTVVTLADLLRPAAE